MIIKRVISIYNSENDRLLSEIDISNISVSFLNEIFDAKEDDPNLFMIYKINERQYAELVKYVPILSGIEFKSSHEIYLECYQV